MSAAIEDRRYAREEYRRWCAEQPRGRFERVDGRIVAMAPERIGHVRTKAAAHRALERAILQAGVACEAFADGVTVETGESDYEPDALVYCGPKLDGNAITATNPVIIVEVIPPGTAAVDTGGKLADYFRVASVQHYLIVHPTRRVIIHHRRAPDGIETKILTAGTIQMDPPGLSLRVEDILAQGSTP